MKRLQKEAAAQRWDLRCKGAEAGMDTQPSCGSADRGTWHLLAAYNPYTLKLRQDICFLSCSTEHHAQSTHMLDKHSTTSDP